MHATPFVKPIRVMSGDYSRLKDADMVVLACGVAQRDKEETRLQLLERNVAIFKKVVPEVLKYTPETILLIVSNPVDIMTEVVTRLSGHPSSRVIGSGTILDTARFRTLLAHHLDVSPRSIHAYVLGEHGDSEVLIWSSAKVSVLSIFDFAEQKGCTITDDIKSKIITFLDDKIRKDISDGKLKAAKLEVHLAENEAAYQSDLELYIKNGFEKEQ